MLAALAETCYLLELIIAIATSDSFRFRVVDGGDS